MTPAPETIRIPRWLRVGDVYRIPDFQRGGTRISQFLGDTVRELRRGPTRVLLFAEVMRNGALGPVYAGALDRIPEIAALNPSLSKEQTTRE